MPSDPGFWVETGNEVIAALVDWLPRLLGVLLVLLVGWLIALISQAIVRGVLRRVGLDRLSERAGMADTLDQMRFDRSASALVGRLVYWLVILFFVLVALEGLGLTAVTETLGVLVSYLPHVLAAVVVLILGAFVARVAGDGVAALAVQYGVQGAALVGRVVQWSLLVLTVVLALDQLQLDTTLIVVLMVVLVGAVALALALAFGLGTRDLAGRIVAGFHAKETFQSGQVLRVGDHTGKLVRIGASTALLETEDGRVSIPNDVLLGEEVVIVSSAGRDSDGPRQSEPE